MENIQELLFTVTKYEQRTTKGLKKTFFADVGIQRLRFKGE